MKLVNYNKDNISKIKKLYRSAFPCVERKSFGFIIRQCEKGEADMLAIETNDGKFVGLAITVMYKDLAMLDYFAIHPKVRGKGIGSRALQMLKARYADKRFFLEIEAVERSGNYEQRKRRREFYLKSGMIPCGFTAYTFFTNMEILTAGKPVTFDEYRALYRSHLGKRIADRIKQVA